MSYGQSLSQESLQKIMEKAEEIAQEKRSQTVEPIHLLLAILQTQNATVKKAVKEYKSQIEQAIDSEISKYPPKAARNATPVPNNQEIQKILETALSIAKKEGIPPEEIHLLLALLKSPEVQKYLKKIDLKNLMESIGTKESRDKSTIDDFAVDMVEQARNGVFDPVIGRNNEIRSVMEVLTKKIKSNAMLLGEPGVGKTAIVNGLAQLIAAGQAPGLSSCKLYNVDIGAIVAGTMYHGQFEERLKTLIKEAENSNRQMILFIDEIHMVLGAGKTQGAMNAANLLKPGLASGAIRCIGATTYGEYKQYVEKDPAFERRFVSINVAEPTVEDTITILRGLRERFETFHGLSILNETLECAAEMGSRYLTGGHMPDTAITLLDAACASVKITLETEPAEIMKLKSRIWAAELEKAAIKADEEREIETDSKEKLQKVEAKINELKNQIVPMQKEYEERMEHIIKRKKLKQKLETMKLKLAEFERIGDSAKAYDIKMFIIPEIQEELDKLGTQDERICIHPEHIAQVVSNITSIPVKRLTVSENQRLLEMESRLNQSVIGQESSVKTVADAIIRSKAGFSRPGRPIGSFLFIGPTGVGKTQLAKSLALELFDDENALVRLDMSEFLEEHSISRLIGAPPGYVGYETGGYLTEKIRNRPYSIILLDEMEKAHKRVTNLFLQVLDDGRLTDSHGRTIDFSNTVILMTSNIGFMGSALKAPYINDEEIYAALKMHFPPEFINRLDSVEIFRTPNEDALMKIVDIHVRKINERIAKNKVCVHLSDMLKKEIVHSTYTTEYGARPMQRYIERTVVTDISKIFLEQNPLKKVDLFAFSKTETPSADLGTLLHGEHFVYAMHQSSSNDMSSSF